MLIGTFGKLLVLFTAVALMAWGMTPGATLGWLAKLLAIDLGAALFVPLVWPHVRGIRKGDKLVVTEEQSKAKIMALFGLFNGKAIDDGRINGVIKVELFDGSVAFGTIVKYEGFLSNAEVRILERSIPIEIKG